MQLLIGDIIVNVNKKRIKNMHIYVKPPYGEVLVTAPISARDKEIENFIRLKSDWIIKNVAKFKTQKQIEFETGDEIFIWGDLYTLILKTGTRYSLELVGNNAIFTVRKGCTKEQKENFINKWYKEEIIERIDILLPKWENYTGFKSSGYRTRNMKSRWGSCNTKNKELCFNINLAKYPIECLDYIILHELIHTVVPNHGEEFKKLLNSYMPEWKEYKKILNE
ncbi:MAG: M48 family metallopeptidase [Ruminococcaceae bacterium]|nr:M48 family metallopeptidase [Oscillospiraceae bacterium]